MTRGLLIGSVMLTVPSVLASTLALASSGVVGNRIGVSPSTGSPGTVFVVSFTTPARSGRDGSVQSHDELTATAPGGAHGCIASIRVTASHPAHGTRVHVSLDPRKLGGSWCSGTYHGHVEEFVRPVCRRGVMCPQYIIARRVGLFALHVR